MKTNQVRFLGLILVLLAVVICSLGDSKESASTGSNPKVDVTTNSSKGAGGSNLVTNSIDDDKGKEKGGQDDKSKEKIADDVNKNKMDSQSGSKDNDNAKGGKDNSSEEFQAKKGDHSKKEDSSSGMESKDLSKENNDKRDTESRKEGPRVEECDQSNRCTDEENKLVACLRVPGNESPDLSLFIQNKGKGPLSVTISAPDFVQLGETNIQLKEKEDKKVKVSITRAGSKKSIVLRAGNGRCELDITDTIAHYFGKEIDKSHKSTDIINFMSRTSTIVVLSFAALLILASGWMCIGFQRKHPSNNSSKYQRLEMELPVSGEVKTESATSEGWDNSWGDDWDDEEAPKTPSLPVTPSLSSKGLASRRLSKEGWKD
ncbi:DENTIN SIALOPHOSPHOPROTEIN-LIKE ISOFORM X1 [Salix koriyanagi]|uniref:DENTIN SIALOPHOSPHOPROTEIN-LIKE ISOFORM X1 n=1 Tax=Salix koriyanagi TaxID=2511006 RepID=A0A9Q0PW06_9ROSI|nr:DENTIN SIALOPHOSPHOPROTEIN-LIKE ISOFORM X1 [Salix koriyanagi]